MRVYNSQTQAFDEVAVANERKPHRLLAGYVAELKNRRTGIGHVVIYLSKEQGLDVSAGKYAIVCETHSNLTQTNSLPMARQIMKAVDFCDECMKV